MGHKKDTIYQIRPINCHFEIECCFKQKSMPKKSKAVIKAVGAAPNSFVNEFHNSFLCIILFHNIFLCTFGNLIGFHGKSTLLYYLIPNPIYIYIYIYIYCNRVKTQTWLSCYHKFISAENITILSVSSDDFFHAFLEVAVYGEYSNILRRNEFIMTT